MKVVIDLSKPLDFFPLFDEKLPIELFNAFGNSIFEENLNLLNQFFPNSQIIVLENGAKQNFLNHGLISGKLFFPEIRFFEKLFLLVSFNNFYGNDTKILFFPGNVRILNFERLFFIITKILNNDTLYSQPLVFFVGTQGVYNQYIEKTDVEEKISDLEIFSAKSISFTPDLKKKDNFFGFTGMCYLHSLKLKEIFCSVKEIAELYFETEELWEKKIGWEKVLLSIKSLDLIDIIMKENPLMVKFDNVKFYNHMNDLFSFFKPDENNNLIKGNIECENVKNSFIVNEDNMKITIKDQSNILIFVRNGLERIEKLPVIML